MTHTLAVIQVIALCVVAAILVLSAFTGRRP